MINYVICSGSRDGLKKYKRIVDYLMMQFDIEYKCSLFVNFDEKFNKAARQDDDYKVYLIDISSKNSFGLDTVKMIREELDDWTSMILIISSNNDLKYEALSNRLLILDYISKIDNYDDIIKDDLLIAMKHYNNREKCLRYEYNHVLKQIEFRHIVYIEKEPDSKRCRIKTNYSVQTINRTLNNTLKLLDLRFIKTSRSMIVNVDQIEEYNIAENKISFRNGEYSYQISRGMKKELKKIVSGSN